MIDNLKKKIFDFIESLLEKISIFNNVTKIVINVIKKIDSIN